MKILAIAYYTILKNFRDKKSISLTLLFPIMLILILGSALSKVYAPTEISKIKVAYLNQDNGIMAMQFDGFIKSKDISTVLELKSVKSYEEGVKAVDDKKTFSFVYLPSDYTENAMSGKKSLLKVYQNSDNVVNMSIVKNIIDSFANGANTMMALSKSGYENRSFEAHKNIKENQIKSEGAVPRAIDYYAVTMLALTLMYGALYASFGMAEDKTERTFIRIKSSPTKPYQNYLGKTLGTIVTLVVQAILLILFTKFAYKSNWGQDMTTVILVSILFSMCTTSLGILAYSITNDSMKASGVINVLVVFFTFISGGYAKISAEGTWFETLSYVSPNKMFQTAIFNTVYGGPAGQVTNCIIALIVITIVMFTLATIFGRRELI